MIIDKCYCINRADRPERKTNSINEFAKIGVDVEFVDAVIGDNLKKNENGLIGGYQGLNQTIISILEDAIEKNYSCIRIFEDDVVFSDDYLTIWNENIDNVPDDFSVFYTGAIYPNGLRTPTVSGIVKRVHVASLGQDLIVNSDIFSDWKDMLESMVAPSDVLLSDIYYCTLNEDGNHKYKAYSFRPGISGQRKGFSDNLQKEVDEIKTS